MSELSAGEQHTALFGTTFRGKEAWFCWRMPFGCAGVIATVAKNTINKSYPQLNLPPRYTTVGDGLYALPSKALLTKRGDPERSHPRDSYRGVIVCLPDSLPVSIQCPPCRQWNQVPSLRGALKIIDGIFQEQRQTKGR
jgi:hypothetical protein